MSNLGAWDTPEIEFRVKDVIAKFGLDLTIDQCKEIAASVLERFPKDLDPKMAPYLTRFLLVLYDSARKDKRNDVTDAQAKEELKKIGQKLQMSEAATADALDTLDIMGLLPEGRHFGAPEN